MPKGTKLYTPLRKLARVDEVDASGRVHVTYLNQRIGSKAEEACFPISLVKASDIYKGTTDPQETCGKGDATAEVKHFWSNTRTLPKL